MITDELIKEAFWTAYDNMRDKRLPRVDDGCVPFLNRALVFTFRELLKLRDAELAQEVQDRIEMINAANELKKIEGRTAKEDE